MSCLTLFPGMAWASCLWPSAGPLVINSERVASLLYFPLLYHSPLVFFTILVYLFPALQKGEPIPLLKIYRVWTGLKYLHLGSSYIHPTFLPIHLKSVQYECNIAYTCKWECQIHLRVHCMDCWIGLDCCQVILFLKILSTLLGPYLTNDHPRVLLVLLGILFDELGTLWIIWGPYWTIKETQPYNPHAI